MSGSASAPQVCAVCGMRGYWVGFSPRYGEDRCLNHLDDVPVQAVLCGDRLPFGLRDLTCGERRGHPGLHMHADGLGQTITWSDLAHELTGR